MWKRLSVFSDGALSHFAATTMGVLKILHQNLWKAHVKKLIFFKLQTKDLQLYKKWGNSQMPLKDFGCTLCWQLYRQPFLRWKFCLATFLALKFLCRVLASLKAYPPTVRQVKCVPGSANFLFRDFGLEKISMNSF